MYHGNKLPPKSETEIYILANSSTRTLLPFVPLASFTIVFEKEQSFDDEGALAIADEEDRGPGGTKGIGTYMVW